MNAPIDWFHRLCVASCFVLPAAFFLWWRKRAHLIDSFDELEMKARRTELATRQRVGAYERLPTLEPVITYRSAAPGDRALAADMPFHPEPSWASSAEYAERRRKALEPWPDDDPAPLFDALVQTAIAVAPVVMENITVSESSVFDCAPSNDNASPDTSFDGGGGGDFSGSGSSGEW